MVVISSGDSATASLVLNWLHHAHALQFHNSIVLCWDRALHARLRRLRISAAHDSSDALKRWCPTRLVNHLQRVFMERLVALAALVISGLDVLHSDADCLFLRDFRPFLQQPEVHIVAQPDSYPQTPAKAFGATACMGFVFFRSTDGVSRFLDDALALSYVQPHHTNAVDQFGFNHALLSWRCTIHNATFVSGKASLASPVLRDSSLGGGLGRLKMTNAPKCTRRRRSGCTRGQYWKCHGSACPRVGLLPPHYFPREGDWAEVAADAYIYHGPTVDGDAGGTGQQEKKIAAMGRAGLWAEHPNQAQAHRLEARLPAQSVLYCPNGVPPER